MTDLINRMDAIQACQVGPSDEWSKATKSGYAQASTDCARNILRIEPTTPAPKAGAVKVKPLVWEGCVARTPFGSYVIHDCRDYREAYRLRMPAGAEGFDTLAHGAEMMFDTQELAQSAAQADYDARIMATIETTPDPRDAVIARLVNAADTILREIRADSYAADHMPEGSRVVLSAAIAAAKEMMK